ncbi:hypothetical protein HDU93_008594 [Gonapodya sp. JEL0774]|nr:hypothetical protein HDU93_008594 [Gonapodya sp. JEL0774]
MSALKDHEITRSIRPVYVGDQKCYFRVQVRRLAIMKYHSANNVKAARQHLLRRESLRRIAKSMHLDADAHLDILEEFAWKDEVPIVDSAWDLNSSSPFYGPPAATQHIVEYLERLQAEMRIRMERLCEHLRELELPFGEKAQGVPDVPHWVLKYGHSKGILGLEPIRMPKLPSGLCYTVRNPI